MKAVLIALCVASTSLTTRASLLATDNAGNYTGWNSGDNFGSGFGAWSLSGSANSGFFIGDSANNAGGSGNINSSGNRAWGLFANSSTTASAIRPFTGGTLGAGQQFLIQMDNGFIQNGGTVGFGLQNNSGVNRFEFYYAAGGANEYTINIGGTTTGTGIGFTGNGLSLVFTEGSGNAWSLDVTPSGGSASHFSGTLAASDIEQVRVFNANAGSGGNNDAFFNNIQVVPEPVNIALGIFGVLAIGSIGFRRFFSRRSP